MLYNRDDEWFLTRDLVMTMTREQDKVANTLIDHVVAVVKGYHEHNRGRLLKTCAESEREWPRLVKAMGQFRHRLLFTTLCEKGGALFVSENNGWPLERWATSFPGLPETVEKVMDFVRLNSTNPLSGDDEVAWVPQSE
jgi:hypothetical protein